MNALFAAVAVSVAAAAVAVLMKQYRPEFAVYISMAAGIAVIVALSVLCADITVEIRSLAELSGISDSNIRLMIKALGVCYIASLASGVCEDAGEKAAAARIEIAGRITLCAMSLPMISQLVGIITQLLS